MKYYTSYAGTVNPEEATCKDLDRLTELESITLLKMQIYVEMQERPVNYRGLDKSCASVANSYALALYNNRYFSDTF